MAEPADPEQLLEDIILDLDGYYPHQMAQKIIERLAAARYEIVHVPEGQRLSLRWDRNAQIAMLNAAEQAEREAYRAL